MDDKKFILKETATVAIGVGICTVVMIGIFALLGHFDMTVLWGGIAGGVLAVLNFFFMAVGATLAADKAEEQNVKGGQATIQASYIGRLAVMALILFALVKSGLCDVFAVVLPLAFNRPILTLTEFFRKEDKV